MNEEWQRKSITVISCVTVHAACFWKFKFEKLMMAGRITEVQIIIVCSINLENAKLQKNCDE